MIALMDIRRVTRAHLVLVLAAYVVRVVTALALVWPLAHSLAPPNVMALPRMDRQLFMPGARLLLEVLAERRAQLLAWLRLAGVWGIVLVLVGAAMTAFAMSVLDNPRASRITSCLRRALASAPSVIAITVIGWITLVLGVLSAGRAVALVPALVYPIFGEKGADVALLLLGIVAAAWILCVFTVMDLARASAVRYAAGSRRALSIGIRSFRAHTMRCLFLASICATGVLVVPAATQLLPPQTASASTLALAFVALLHQIIALSLCALHLWWWACALGLVQVSLQQNQEENQQNSDQ